MTLLMRILLSICLVPAVLNAQKPQSSGYGRALTSGSSRPQIFAADLSPMITGQRGMSPALPDGKRVLVASDTRPDHVGRFAVVGLAIGATVGIIGGAVGSRYIGCGCSDRQKTIGFALWFGGIGAAAGTAIGALTGMLVPARE